MATTNQNNEMEQPSETENDNKNSKLCSMLKYAYVISAFIFGVGLVGLKFLSSGFDDWLDEMQQDVLNFFLDNNSIYIILVVLLITIAKGVGLKDVLSVRVIAVVILSYKIAPNSKGGIFCLSILILGILSSISKLLEYRAIGKELQVVQGTPVKYIFKYIRKLLLFCISNEDKIEWVDPKFTFAISDISRQDRNMDLYSNFYRIISVYQCNKNNENENDSDSTKANQGRHDVGSEDEITEKLSKLQHGLCKVIVFLISVVWTSVIEWVQPITELFQYAHNWTLSTRNVIIIILSEMVDFDKMVEVILIIDSLMESGDVIAGKIKGILFKPLFWALGYLIVLPLTLLWAYAYYTKFSDDFDIVALQINGNNLEMHHTVPPLDRTATPLLMDTEEYVREFPDVANGKDEDRDSAVWKRMKFTHNQEPQQKNAINFANCKDESIVFVM